MTQQKPEFPNEFSLADYYLFDRLKEGRGERIALRFGSETYTYHQVAQRAAAVSRLLEDQGLRAGERVLIIARDLPSFVWSFFGALKAGGVVVMGNPDGPVESLPYLVKYTQAAVVMAPSRVLRELARQGVVLGTDARCFAMAEPATGEPCRGVVAKREGLSGCADLEQSLRPWLGKGACERVIYRDQPAIWLFTSGSTGKPKAAMHTNRDFAFNTEVFAKGLMQLSESDITVSVPRLFFGYATGTNLLFPFAVGASVGLFAERPTPESFVDAIARYGPTVLTQVPTMMTKILEFDRKARAAGEAGIDLSQVRFSYSAGEALPAPLLERWRKRFDSEVYDGIGSAEMFHIYCTNRPGDVRAGSLGKVVPGYELRVLSQEATGPNAEPCKPNEIGVLWVKGDSVAQGYWLDRDKSWATFHGHWCRTGDLFHVDEEGYLYFDGRADDLIKVSGIFVSPVEVESCLLTHSLVQQVAVIATNLDGLIKPKALVITKGELDNEQQLRLAQELKDLVKDTLAKHKYPRLVAFVSELPKNDRGKLNRKLLRKQEAAGELPIGVLQWKNLIPGWPT